MTKTLTFVHTSSVHIATFDQLLDEIAPDIPVHHIVDETLLQDARTFGFTDALRTRVTETLIQAFVADAGVVVCTCSTIGGYAEQALADPTRPVLRVDRAMAQHAVSIGSRIVVAAALASTLASTSSLLYDAAHTIGKTIKLHELFCDDAWAYFEQGDMLGYNQVITAHLHQAASVGDVIVLAQASMAGSIPFCTDITVPILSSPRLGVQTAIQTYQNMKWSGQ